MIPSVKQFKDWQWNPEFRYPLRFNILSSHFYKQDLRVLELSF